MSGDMVPVAGAPYYYVTPDGRLLSTHRADRLGAKAGELHEVRGGVAKNGYVVVRLKWEDGKYRTRTIHSLIADAFLGPRPPWHQEIRHLDGNKRNNTASNLAWGTIADNQGDPDAVAKRRRGDASNLAKLTASQARDARRMRAEGVSAREIAARFGVSVQAITHIIAGRSWRHLAEEQGS